MQPYIFPYIGYFQLVNAVDTFVFYDDVNFIKQGWINRNRILVGGKDYLFTIPVGQISSYAFISQTAIHARNYEVWKGKFLRTIEQNYRRAPFFNEACPLISGIVNEQCSSIAELASISVQRIAKYLRIPTEFKTSSVEFADSHSLARADRLIEICKRLGATEYINPIGGQDLYQKEYFYDQGIKLSFLKSADNIQYCQFNQQNFVPWLSIIDVLMFNKEEEIRNLLLQYSLL